MMSDIGAASATGPGFVALVPRINLQAFCETPQMLQSCESAFADRRMARAHGTAMMGGISAAVRLYQTQSTPNLLLVETNDERDALLASLSTLAEVCQPDTKVVVIGHVNDVILYRELIRKGVSEYIVAPVSPLQLIETIASLYRGEKAAPIGRVIAFMGTRGGTGSSTISHNCAWDLARSSDVETTIIDLDLAYGTADLDFNVDSPGRIMEALVQPDRIDSLLLDRLLVRIGGKLNLLAGSGGVDSDFVIETHAIEALLLAMRASMPLIILDVPSIWAPWVKFTLLQADEVVLTAEPELASIRNTRAIVDLLKAARPNDRPPAVVLNKTGVPKRPEISGADFRKAIGTEVTATVPFDPQNFGGALNNGRMLLDMYPRSKAAEALRRMSQGLSRDKAPRGEPLEKSLIKKLMVLGKK